MRTVFVGGIHGAGKTTLVRRLSLDLDLREFSAGRLLREREVTGSGTSKASSSFESDQLYVVERLLEITGQREDILLDGHFALSLSDGEVLHIPERFFRRLNPVALLLLDVPVGVARDRLLRRDGKAPPAAFLATLRNEELAAATNVGHSLSLPLCVLRRARSYEEALRFVSDVLE